MTDEKPSKITREFLPKRRLKERIWLRVLGTSQSPRTLSNSKEGDL